MNAVASSAEKIMEQADLSTQWSILLTACSVLPSRERSARLRDLLLQTDYSALLALAEKHGTQPLLHHALSPIANAVPGDLMRPLQQSIQTNLLKSLLISRELLRIVDTFTRLGLPVMPHKGPALAELLYGDIAMRQSGDIDLLIRPQDFARARAAARELGYTPHHSLSSQQDHAYLQSGYECVFDGPAGRNLLELQWAIQPRFYSIEFDMDALFHRSVPLNVAGQQMQSPSLEDLFLVLSVHAAKHVWGKLIWLSDLAQLMSRPTLQWDTIGEQAHDLGIIRIVRVTMNLAHELLDAPIPDAAEVNVPQDDQARTLARQVQSALLGCGEKEADVESVAYFRLMLRLRERQRDRLRFVQRLIFTPSLSEWSAISLPPLLFPMYRLFRVARLTTKFIRR